MAGMYQPKGIWPLIACELKAQRVYASLVDGKEAFELLEHCVAMTDRLAKEPWDHSYSRAYIHNE